MMKIKVGFCDFWPGFDKDNFFLSFLRSHFPNVELSPDPDYVFYSVYGTSHLQYSKAIKICFTGENVLPDFNHCDYALGCNDFAFKDRYLRFPLYLIYPGFSSLKTPKVLEPDRLLNRKFCNFVYSNSVFADPVREEFFRRLSGYKKVDSGGKHLNNIGFTVGDKVEFIADYKFTIAFENSSVEGYTTEKIMEPMRVNSLPVYWGNPNVDRDFNVSSFINCMRFQSIDQAVEEVVRLDKNDLAYLEMIGQPWLTKSQSEYDWGGALRSFLSNVFVQSKEEARRFPRYGFNKFHVEELRLAAELLSKKRRTDRFKWMVRNMVPWGLKRWGVH